MGFLFLSVDYPTDEARDAFFQATGPSFMRPTSALHEPLPASATLEEWKRIMNWIKAKQALPSPSPSSASASSSSSQPNNSAATWTWTSLLLTTTKVRPLKPNDDNYAAFVGPQWKRRPQPQEQQKMGRNIPPEIAGFLRTDDPTPHYERCARCTQPSSTRCAQCKIVHYCSRHCQAKHWPACHKHSCVPAQERTLLQVLQTNDGFLVTDEECRGLSKLLWTHSEATTSSTSKPLRPVNKDEDDDDDELIRCLALYFEHVSKLGGCFVV